MSLPIARARRKKVPSIQRSPNSSTRSHSRDAVGEAEGGDVAGRPASSPTSHSSLISRISETTRAKSSSRVLVAGRPARRRRWTTPRSTRVLPVPARRRRRSSMWRTSRPSEAEISFSDGPAADPQLAVLAVAEELVGVAGRARPGVEHGLAVRRSPAPRRWSGCRRSRCAPCRRGSGSRCRRSAP